MSLDQKRGTIPKGSVFSLPSTKAGRIRLIGLLGLNILQFAFPGIAPTVLGLIREIVKSIP